MVPGIFKHLPLLLENHILAPGLLVGVVYKQYPHKNCFLPFLLRWALIPTAATVYFTLSA
jgi:hypothetical protein